MTLCLGLILCLAALAGTVTAESFSQCDSRANGDYIPGLRGCRSFIYCSGDYSYEDSCPVGLYFNPDEGICDDPANVPCHDDESTDEKPVKLPKEPEISILLTEQAPIAPAVTTKAGKPTPPGPPVPTSTQAQAPNGTTTGSTSWPTTTVTPVWTTNSNSSWPAYNWPNTTIVPLTSTQGPPANISNWPTSTISTTTTEEVTWSTPNTTPPSSPASQIELMRERCSKVMGGYFPYPNECRYFYRCTNGQLIKQECAQGYGWDAKLKMCTTSGCSYRDAPIVNKK